MNKPKPEEQIQNSLERISRSITALGGTIERMYNDWKFPVQTMAEQMEPQWKEEREEKRVEQQLELLKRQNTILIKTVTIAVAGVILTALVGILDIILRIFFNK